MMTPACAWLVDDETGRFMPVGHERSRSEVGDMVVDGSKLYRVAGDGRLWLIGEGEPALEGQPQAAEVVAV